MLAELAPRVGFDYSVDVLRHHRGRADDDRLDRAADARSAGHLARAAARLLPGRLGRRRAGGRRAGRARPARLAAAWASSSATSRAAGDYGGYDIEILAEINHAPRLTLAEILAEADRLRADGADVIDVGCDPGEPGRASARPCGPWSTRATAFRSTA